MKPKSALHFGTRVTAAVCKKSMIFTTSSSNQQIIRMARWLIGKVSDTGA